MAAPKLVARMIWECELAKRRLSRAEATTVPIPDANGDRRANAPEETVTRAQFQKWTAHLVDRLETPIRRVLRDGGLRTGDVHEVILVGGATRMPVVVERVLQLFGKPPHCRLNADEVVALGAAVQAGLVANDRSVEDLVVTDVAPFTLGIEVTKKFGTELRDGYYLPVIHRNTTIPASRVEQVATLLPNQPDIVVKLYQGESRRVSENLLLGEFVVKGVPRGPAGQLLDIRFTYDLNGVLEVEATVVATRQKTTHVVTRYARGLSQTQIADAVRAMDKLKTHPRDEAANRLLLRRAERTIKELAQPQRDILNQLLDGLEEALALRDPETIERHRAVLQSYLDQFEADAATGTEESDDDEPR
jgi:molecular chaperone HscC